MQDIITELIKNNPNYKPPPDYRIEKKTRKLRIPVDEYPGYNFIGLIIGPRGNTQVRLLAGPRVLPRPAALQCPLHDPALHDPPHEHAHALAPTHAITRALLPRRAARRSAWSARPTRRSRSAGAAA